jgi:PAS domain S-box-containing protein
VLCILALGCHWLGAAEPKPIKLARVGVPLEQRGTLRVLAGSGNNFPYSFREPDGHMTGFTHELFDAIVRVQNLKVDRVYVVGPGAIADGFKKGEYDILQSYTDTAARTAYADFSEPILSLQGVVIVQKQGSPITKLTDFNGRRFAVVGDASSGEEFLRTRGLRPEIVRAASTIQALDMVETGACAGTYVSQLTALSLMKQSGLHNLAQFGPVVTDLDIRQCIAVHKGDVELLARLNEGLAILHRTGEYGRIYQKWFGRLSSPLITREKVFTYAAMALAAALAVVCWGYLRQRRLRHRVARQAAELATQQALLQALYDNIPLAICVLEVAGDDRRVVAINRGAEAFFGTTAAEAAGRLLRDLPLEAEWRAQLDALLAEGRTATGLLREERLFAATRRRMIFTLVPMDAGPTGGRRVCVIAEDITERRNLDDELAQSRKLRAVGELVGGIAHEFNNLLTPVILQVGLIQCEWAADERLVKEVRMIDEPARRAAELTRRLLMFGRKNDNVVESVHLDAVVSSCFALLRLTVDRRIHWEQAVPANLPPLAFNTTDLNQIILNLVLNARDTLLEKLALQPEGWTPVIRIEAQHLPAYTVERLGDTPSRRQILGWQRLTVRDNGMGMTAEVRERIFEPFYTTKAVGSGTGLGLATVWQLVTAASGRIEVESTPAEGTAFHVSLPMFPSSDAAHAVAAPVSAVKPATMRIFLAEDDGQVAGSILAALRREGHDITHLSDGSAAWQHLEQAASDYDLLVLDVNMPGLDGIEVAQRVRDSRGFTGRLMIISGRLDSEDLHQIATLDIDCVLSKPFNLAELLDAVRNCARQPRKATALSSTS